MIKSVSILGSTGSIGRQALEVCSQFNIRVSSLACASNIDLLFQQIQLFRPDFVAVYQEEAASALERRFNEQSATYRCPVLRGTAGINEVAADAAAEMVLAAMVGMQGIEAVITAIRSGHSIALANKEVLVAAGDLINSLLDIYKVKLHPVDSEHSAIWQCLQTGHRDELRRIFLTASGGPFRGWSREALVSVRPEHALKHPTWRMGQKISIDSATMMNKGLEIIEAAKLFHLNAEEIEVVVHPQSVIHSMVEWQDGSVIAQLSAPDMCLPIQLAFSWPERWMADQRHFNPFDPVHSKLTFEAVDAQAFPAIGLAFSALRTGGTLPLALNSSNEVAVEAFLEGRLSFLGISETVEEVMNLHVSKGFINQANLDDMIATDRDIRRLTKEIIGWND